MATCEKCNDRGAYGLKEPAEHRRLADGSTLVSGPAFLTIHCECRKALPPRDGKAKWWSTERISTIEVGIPIFDETVTVKVDAEVPISADNFRVHRRGNRYYPTLIDVETPPSLTLHSDTARDFARALLAAADAADMVDNADRDRCGHWAPCGCDQTSVIA